MRYLIMLALVFTMATPAWAMAPEPVPVSAATFPQAVVSQFQITAADVPPTWVASPVTQPGPNAAFIAGEVVLFAGIDTPSGDVVAVANTIYAVDVKDTGLLQLDVLLPGAVNGYVKGDWAVTIMETPVPVIGDRSMAYSIAKTSDSGRSYIEMLAFVQYDVLVIVTVASTGQSYDTLAETVRLAQIVSSRITAYQYPTPVPMTTLEG